MERVVVGLSGGVDSSVAAWLLKRQGYDVVGLFMINWHDTTGTLEGDCPWYDDRVFAELVAKRLDIPLHTVDLSEEYRRRVVDYMFAEYERGRTPNPDVLCNREIKFDVFLKEALRLGADFVATGHYCRKECFAAQDGTTHYRLLAGVDKNKDQSYFLCQLSQQQLARALFPVGGLEKPEVRRIAEEQHLATARRKDSQGICFVGKVDLPVFLQQKLAARRGAVHEIPATWPKYDRPVAGDDLAALAEHPLPQTLRELTNKAEISAENLRLMLDNFLDVSRLDVGGIKYHPREFDIGGLMLRIASESADLAAEKSIKFHCLGRKQTVWGDPVLIERIIRNLLENALKFTRNKIVLGSRKEKNKLRIMILDNGNGIIPEEKELIFKEFYQSRRQKGRQYGGSGLGLAIVNKLTMLMKSRLDLDTIPGRGSCFSFTLPLYKPAENS